MKVVIAGAGEVGLYLAKMMAKESQDIYLIDNNEDHLQRALEHVDVYGIQGKANETSVLNQAKLSSSDLFIAATSAEETNLLIGILAKKLGAKRVIVRVNYFKTIGSETMDIYRSLGIDTIICPVASAANEIERMIVNPYFTESYEFEEGKLTVFGIVVEADSPLVGKSIEETSYLNPNLSFKPFALTSKEYCGAISKGTIIREGDIVYFISKPQGIIEIPKFCVKKAFSIKNIMIIGGGSVGSLVAERLQKKMNVTIVERNEKIANDIASRLDKSLVVNADARNTEVLIEENLETMDAFLALSDDSEINLISSFFAKKIGVRKTIAKVSNIEHINLSHNMGIDALINKKVIAANEIMTFVMGDSVQAMANLLEMDSELIEFTANSTNKIISDKIKNLNLPSGANMIGVIRNSEGLIPFGDFQVQTGDKAICYVENGCKQEFMKFIS